MGSHGSYATRQYQHNLLGFSFLNFDKLTDNDDQIKHSELADGLSHAQDLGSQVVFGAELGTTRHTGPLESTSHASDWATSSRAVKGTGVGAFFGNGLPGVWSTVDADSTPSNIRFYLVENEFNSLLVGVFYTPHQGYNDDARTALFKLLRDLWASARRKHPRASQMLVGDANLPWMWAPGRKRIVPRSGPEKFFHDHFARHMVIASCFFGGAQGTHRRGNVLDIMLLSPDLVLDDFHVSEPGIAGSDHSMITAQIR